MSFDYVKKGFSQNPRSNLGYLGKNRRTKQIPKVSGQGGEFGSTGKRRYHLFSQGNGE